MLSQAAAKPGASSLAPPESEGRSIFQEIKSLFSPNPCHRGVFFPQCQAVTHVGPSTPVTHKSSGPAFRNMLQVRVGKQIDSCPTNICAFWDSFFLPQIPCAAVIVPLRVACSMRCLYCPENTRGSYGKFPN